MADDATKANEADVSKDPKSGAIPAQPAVPPTTAGAAFPPGTPEPIIMEDPVPVPANPKPVPPPAPAPAPAPAPKPTPSIVAPTPEIKPVTSAAAPQTDTTKQTDVTKILGDIKLPERHNQIKPEVVPQQKYDTTLADPTREMPHAVPGFTPPEQPADAAQPLKADTVGSLHTLKDDLQHVVQENKISYVRAVALEEEKRHRIEERSPMPAVNKRSMFTLFIVILLVATGLLALGAVFMVMQQRTSETDASLRSSILFAEQTVPFPIDNEAPGDIKRTLASARTSNSLTLGAVLQIMPVKTVTDPETGQVTGSAVSFGEFLTAIGARAPGELARALGDEFFFGIHTVDENAPVIIIPVTSYERAFAAMLEWEPLMNADLEPLFTVLSPQAAGPNGTITERKFEDTVMRNYDVRALKDDSGMIQLYYSFPTRNVLIIAESPYSFSEILSRLRADRRL
jgi:hypothetical protein